MNSEQEHQDTVIESLFVRNRNALLLKADFSALFKQWETYTTKNNILQLDDLTPIFKDFLAAFALHCASKPRQNTIAWTVNLQDPLVNIFLSGDTYDDFVTGRLFWENVAKADSNSFHQELVPRNKEAFKSFVPFTGNDAVSAVESFYEQSEQRPARFFKLSETEYALLSAHPDWDEDWFYQVKTEDIPQLNEKETINGIEKRTSTWACGCNQEKIMKALAPVFERTPQEIFQGENSITVSCPRCARYYVITYETLEAHLKDEKNKK